MLRATHARWNPAFPVATGLPGRQRPLEWWCHPIISNALGSPIDQRVDSEGIFQPASILTMAAKWAESTGLATCSWNPDSMARCRSASLARAVSAAAGTRPPCSAFRFLTFWMKLNPSSPGMAMSEMMAWG